MDVHLHTAAGNFQIQNKNLSQTLDRESRAEREKLDEHDNLLEIHDEVVIPQGVVAQSMHQLRQSKLKIRENDQ